MMNEQDDLILGYEGVPLLPPTPPAPAVVLQYISKTRLKQLLPLAEGNSKLLIQKELKRRPHGPRHTKPKR